MLNKDIIENYYKWILYCAFSNKMYCNTCMEFSVDLSNASVYGEVVTIKNICIKFQMHENTATHKTARESYLYKSFCFFLRD
jgi:hypothetical protein